MRLLKALSVGLLVAGLVAALVPGVVVADGSVADHVVISEVLPNPSGSDDGKEYVELYNPLDTSINIGGWVIDTDNDTDADATIPDGQTISSHGFYLIGDDPWTPESDWPSSPDHVEEIWLYNDNSWVRLRKTSGGEIVDRLGWGSGAEVYEASPYPDNPPEGESLQRKISDTQDEDSYGPAWDTDNNANDFFIQDSPNPQNSNSEPMPPVPNLPTIMLFSIGVMVLGGYIWFGKRRELATCDS